MVQPAFQSETVAIRAETPFDAAAIERLVADAFGPGRFAKTAERLREGTTPAAGWIATVDGRPAGTVRLWPVVIGQTPALFLGPIAVDAEARKAGLGAQLVQAAVAHADAEGMGVLLVGDAPYFGRFGFVAASGVALPGPVDPRRLLWRGAEGVAGPVRAA